MLVGRNDGYFAGFLEVADVVVHVVILRLFCALGVVIDFVVDGVVSIAVPADDASCECVGDEVAVAVDAVHAFLSLVETCDEIVGGERFVASDDRSEDVLDGCCLDEACLDSGVVGCGDDLLWEVVLVDGEGELELVVASDATDALYDRCGALVGDTEDVVGDGEELLANEASGALCPADEVVADAEQGGAVVVEHLTHHEIEVVGTEHAALGGEVVKIVDDDECGLESVDGLEDFVMDEGAVLVEGADDIKAHQLEVLVVDIEAALEVVDEAAGGVEGMDSVDPEHFAGRGLHLAAVMVVA